MCPQENFHACAPRSSVHLVGLRPRGLGGAGARPVAYPDERAAEAFLRSRPGTLRRKLPTRLAAQPRLEEMHVYDQAIGNAREGVGEQVRTKVAIRLAMREDRDSRQRRDRCHTSVAVQRCKEDAVKEETVKPVATATATEVGAGAPRRPAPQQDLSWTKGDFKITLFGAVRLDAYFNSARTQGAGLPAFLFPKFAGGFSQHNMSMNARNSMVGLLFTRTRYREIPFRREDIGGVFRQHQCLCRQ